MIQYWRFLLVPVILTVLLVFYFNFVDLLASGGITVTDVVKPNKAAGAEVVGVSTAVSIQVTRSYLFGLVSLPIYAPGIGSIAGMHTAFFWLMGLLTAGLPAGLFVIQRRELNMPKFGYSSSNSNIWLRLGKAIGVGAIFSVVAILFLDPSLSSLSIPLGLLVAYLEFRAFEE